jgi:hypothetical protein
LHHVATICLKTLDSQTKLTKTNIYFPLLLKHFIFRQRTGGGHDVCRLGGQVEALGLSFSLLYLFISQQFVGRLRRSNKVMI